MKDLLILGIDTSCDETSVSVLNNLRVLSNVMPSQIEFHKKYGGVVPSIAKLAHIERIDNVVTESLKRASKSLEDIDLIAVTYGPGLAIALEVGLNKAKELSLKYNKPLFPINHMEAHLLSNFVRRNTSKTDKTKVKETKNELRSNLDSVKNIDDIKELNNVKFPSLGVLVSGNHTELILIEAFGKYIKIGETLDDASGEAFDKCGRMLGLGYPAGPVIAKLSKENRKNVSLEVLKRNKGVIAKVTNLKNKKSYELPIPMVNSNDLNFSYSGLKTAFNQLVNSIKDLDSQTIKDLCVLIEFSNTYQIVFKVEKALKQHNVNEIWLGGGVAANLTLRSLLRDVSKKNSLKFRYPYSNKVTGDNAAMIAVTAFVNLYTLKNLRDSDKVLFEGEDILKVDRDPSLSL